MVVYQNTKLNIFFFLIINMGNTYSTDIDNVGNKFWYKNGKLHRDGDLPAIEWANGEKCWYKNGYRHRDNDLPALELIDGTKEWCIVMMTYR